MEYLFRALNDEDVTILKNTNTIKCPILRNDFNKEKGTEKYNLHYDYLKYYNEKFANSFNVVYGHINGSRTKDKTSCWISATKDFEIVLTEYAIIQNGKYNPSTKRRFIAVIKEESLNDYVIDTNNEKLKITDSKIKNLKVAKEAMLILSKENLTFLHEEGIIKPEISDINSPLTARTKRTNLRLDGSTPKCTGLNGYSESDDEVLIYSTIDSSKILGIIPPLYADILYNVINPDYKYFIENYIYIRKTIDKAIDKCTPFEKTLFAFLYTKNGKYEYSTNIDDYGSNHKVLASNLTDIALQYGTTSILENYNILKDKKRKLLFNIMKELKKEDIIENFNERVKLADDKVYIAKKINEDIILNDGEVLFESKIHSNKIKNDIVIYIDEFGNIEKPSENKQISFKDYRPSKKSKNYIK